MSKTLQSKVQTKEEILNEYRITFIKETPLILEKTSFIEEILELSKYVICMENFVYNQYKKDWDLWRA